jgi:hypothetical protein
MKHLILAIVLGLAMSGVSLADCEDDCNGPFQTCLNICRQTTKEDSPEASECVNNCLNGVSGCIRRCRDKDKKNENSGNYTKGYLLASCDLEAGDKNNILAAGCIEEGLMCVLNGTSCCAPYECKGKFPNTYCK